MSQIPNQRVAYFNGDILPESEVRVSFLDRGSKFGDAVVDMARTFGYKPFKLKEHVDRLYDSLTYCQIDPGLHADEMLRLSEQVLEINLPLLPPDSDYWLGQRVSRGFDAVEDEAPDHPGANVIIECTPIPFKARAAHFRDGIDVIVPSVRRTPPSSLSPRAKTHNYLNMIMGDLEVHARDGNAWVNCLSR